MTKYVRLLSVAVAAVLLLLCALPAISAEDKVESADGGFVNVEDFGAYGEDKNDDYAAFEAALATGKNLYIPDGTFYLSKSIKVSDKIVRGSHHGQTTLYGTMDPKDPVVIMEGISSFSEICIAFTENKMSIGSTQGERVGIQLGTKEKGLQPGSVIESVQLSRVGTGLYNPADAAMNGVMLDNIQVHYYFYRGMDLQGENRTANGYSNIYINSHDYDDDIEVDTGLAMEGSSYGETMHQINVEHSTFMNRAITFKNAKALNISVMHLEGINVGVDNNGWIYCENTSGYIGTLTNYFSYHSHKNSSMIELGNSSDDSLVIGVLHNRGLNSPDTNSHLDWVAQIEEAGYKKGMSVGGPRCKEFRLLRRTKGAQGDYSVNIDFYSYLSYIAGTEEASYYLNWKEPTDNISITLNHEPKEAIRP